MQTNLIFCKFAAIYVFVHDPNNAVHDPNNAVHDPNNVVHDPNKSLHRLLQATASFHAQTLCVLCYLDSRVDPYVAMCPCIGMFAFVHLQTF